MMFQCLIKVYAMRYGHKVIELIDKLVDIYKANKDHRSQRRLKMLDFFVTITEYVFIAGISIYTLTLVAYFFTPLVIYILEHKLVKMLPISLPFLDDQTAIGYTIMTIFQTSGLLGSYFGIGSNDFVFTMIIMNVHVLANIFSDSVTALNDGLKEKHPNRIAVKAHFLNTLLLNNEIAEWVFTLT